MQLDIGSADNVLLSIIIFLLLIIRPRLLLEPIVTVFTFIFIICCYGLVFIVYFVVYVAAFIFYFLINFLGLSVALIMTAPFISFTVIIICLSLL